MIEQFIQQFADGIRAGSLTTPSRWAKHKFYLPDLHTHEPKPYSLKYHPWCEEVLNSEAPYNTVQKAAQTGLTVTAMIRAFYTIDALTRNVLYVLPTSKNAGDFSKGRFNTAITLSPHLKDLFQKTDSVSLKQAGHSNLYIRGSRGASNLVEVPASVLILDEVDRMDQEAISKARYRLSGHLDKNVFEISTPTVPNHGVNKSYKKGTQEHFVFPCPRCSRHTHLVWPDCVEIVGESILDPRVEESYLKCKECGGKLDHELKPEWLGNAHWEAMSHEANPDRRSFYVNQLYSYTMTPGELVTKYFEGEEDVAGEVEFVNQTCGLPHVPEGAQVTKELYDHAKRGHSIHDPRPKVASEKLTTLGIDQGKKNYYTVCEWLVERWSNDLCTHSLCRVLDAGSFHEENWERLDELMQEWQILHAVLDADPQISVARQYARKYEGFIHLCRYRRGKTGREISISEEETGAPMATVDRTAWLSTSLRRFHNNKIEVPHDVTPLLFQHCNNMVRTYVTDPDTGEMTSRWINTGADHLAHSLTYAQIALPFAAQKTHGKPITTYL